MQTFDLLAHIRRHMEFSARTFGPGPRAAGVIDHIRKELREIEAAPDDLEEWIDVLMLALDGAWRSGARKTGRRLAGKGIDGRDLPTGGGAGRARQPTQLALARTCGSVRA